jgi:hypothetical protein
VGSCDVKFPIRLEGLCYAHSFFASVCAHTRLTRQSPLTHCLLTHTDILHRA